MENAVFLGENSDLLSESDKKLLWKENGRKPLLQTPVLNVTQTESTSSDGLTGNYIVMEARDWVVVIPALDDDFIMVKQWRHGSSSLSVEFPGGVIESGENPETGAERELLEETGYKAGKLVHLGTMSPNPALFSNHVHFYAALELSDTGKQSLDSDEYLNAFKMPKSRVFSEMGSGLFQHALMAAALGLYREKIGK